MEKCGGNGRTGNRKVTYKYEMHKPHRHTLVDSFSSMFINAYALPVVHWQVLQALCVFRNLVSQVHNFVPSIAQQPTVFYESRYNSVVCIIMYSAGSHWICGANLWRQAVLRDHGGATRRLELSYTMMTTTTTKTQDHKFTMTSYFCQWQRLVYQCSAVCSRSHCTQYDRLLAWYCRLFICLSVCDAVHRG